MEISKKLKSEISAEYFALKEKNEAEYERNREILYIEHPSLKELDTEISLTALRCAQKIANSQRTVEDVTNEMLETLDKLKSKRQTYILKNNINPDYLYPKYDCEICQDTGFKDKKMCKCYKNKLTQKLYEASHITDEGKKCTFKNFKLDFYDDKDIYNLGITPLENIKEVLMACKKFCENFDKNKNGVYICGNAGVGKTYLSHAIANYLISRGHTVLYQNAFRLFSFLEDYKFLRVDRIENDDFYDYIYNCDMLIIDDLGTEFSLPYSQSQMFDILEMRTIAKKRNIISTNLSLETLASKYSSRFTSRLIENYNVVFFKDEDIRIKTSIC